MLRFGNEIAKANASVTQTIKFLFRGQQSERFSTEVACNGKAITEDFEI